MTLSSICDWPPVSDNKGQGQWIGNSSPTVERGSEPRRTCFRGGNSIQWEPRPEWRRCLRLLDTVRRCREFGGVSPTADGGGVPGEWRHDATDDGGVAGRVVLSRSHV